MVVCWAERDSAVTRGLRWMWNGERRERRGYQLAKGGLIERQDCFWDGFGIGAAGAGGGNNRYTMQQRQGAAHRHHKC